MPGSLPGGVFSIDLLEQRSGLIVFRASGNGAFQTFEKEGGGIRWQRIPPTERRGRVQTSSITVAVLREAKPEELRIDDKDLNIKTTKSSGPGGQNRNKVETCVVITHKPSGLVIRSDSERSQFQNKEFGLALLRSKLLATQKLNKISKDNEVRRNQIGEGYRGQKNRTVRFDGVTDHNTGKRMELKRYEKGFLEDLW